MANDTRVTLNPQFIIGLGLVLFGGLLTLDRMQILDAGQSLRYWPIVLVALGAWIVIERRESGRSLPGYVLLIAGSLLLLDAMGVVRVRFWELFWPLIIVLVGARMVMQTPSYRRRRMTLTATATAGGSMQSASAPEGTVSMFSVLGSDQRTINDKAFRGGDVTTIVGGTQLDLRQAAIEPGADATINIFVLMGGHELWVPAGWTVVVEVTPVLGGVEDKRLPQVFDGATRPAGTPPRLVLRGVVMLGGLTIKN